jgi:hypothetical protein
MAMNADTPTATGSLISFIHIVAGPQVETALKHADGLRGRFQLSLALLPQN